MKKERVKVTDLTPEVLDSLDQETLIALVMRLYEQNKQLSEQLRIYVMEKYGPRTERFGNPDQLRLFNSAAQTTEVSTSKEPESHAPTKQPLSKKTGHGRNPMPSNLPRVQVRGTPDTHALNCHCGGQRLKVNEVLRNSRYEFVPSSLVVEEILDSVYECAACHDTVVVPAQICEPIANGTAGPGLIASVISDKYCDHMPNHRQVQRFARHDANIPRSTIDGWLDVTAKKLRSLYNEMNSRLLQAKAIATDDSPVKVQDRARKNNMKTGRIWIYRGDESQPFNVFAFTQGRGRDGPISFLRGFSGYLLGDCFSGNQAVCTESGCTHIACNVHARRYFVKALPNNKRGAEEALAMYHALFEIERTAKELNLTSAQRYQMRQEEAVPLLTRMKDWLDKERLTALPNSAYGKAVTYCLNNWTALTAYLQDGDLSADNNLAEQEMKHLAIGRKNWMFFGSDDGGENAAIFLSLISTCKRHGVEPWRYLKHVIETLTANPQADLHPLLPNNWALAHTPRLSEMTHVKDAPKVA